MTHPVTFRSHSPFSRRLRALGGALALGLCSALFAAEEKPQAFDLPAGDAVATLRRFSDASGRELLFSAPAVRGVRTAAVQGELTPTQALERMLAGTPLIASADAETGAFAVRRGVDAEKNDGDRAPVAPVPAAREGGVGEREPAGRARRAREESSDENGLMLTPFEVNSDRDRGFESTAVGTGSRMALDMRTAPVPFSAVNRELIDALGITNMQEAADWTANAGSGVFDAFGGGDSFGLYVVFGVRGQSSTGNTQGLQQRDYYQNASIGDSYNVERFEFGRGANAAIFGIGLLTGTQSAQGKTARFRSQTTVSAQVGSWDLYRGTFDYNQPLTEKLAVRINGVLQESGGYFDNKTWNRQGLTANLVYRISPTFEVKLDASVEKQARTNPYSSLPNRFSGWDGVTVGTGPITNAMFSNSATPGQPNALGQRLTFNGEPQGVARRATGYNVFHAAGGGSSIYAYDNFAFTRASDSTARVPVYIGDQVLVRQNTNSSTVGYGIDGINTTGLPDYLPDFYEHAMQFSGLQLPGRRFTMALDRPVLIQRNRNLTLTGSKRFGTSLFVEAGMNVNSVPTDRFNTGFMNEASNVYIDIDRTLPDGTPNPRFLEPYGDGTVREGHEETNAFTPRLNIVYQKDLGAWGNYRLNLDGSMVMREERSRDESLSLARDADPRLWVIRDSVRQRQYWSDEERPYSRERYLEPFTYTYWDFTAPNSPVMKSQTVTPRFVNTFEREIEREWRSAGAQLQATYFKKLTVLLKNNYNYRATSFRESVATGDLPEGWDGVTLPTRPDAPEDWLGLTYRPVNANGQFTTSGPVPAINRPRITVDGLSVRDPRYENDRFRSDYNRPENNSETSVFSYGANLSIFKWMSVFGNYSNAYNPPDAGTYTLDQQLKIPETGKDYNFGLRFFLLNENLTVYYTRFQSQRDYASINSPLIGDFNSLAESTAAGDPLIDSRNPFGIPNLDNGDYQFVESYGNEIEITGRLGGLRLTLNYGDNRAEIATRYSLTRAFMEDPVNQDIFIQLLESAGGQLDRTRPTNGAAGFAVVPPVGTYPAGTPLNDQTRAVNSYNQMWQRYATAVRDDVPLLSPINRKYNVYADYTVQTGLLKRLRLGGGVKWGSKGIIGDRSSDTIVDPANPTRAIDDPTVGLSDYLFTPRLFDTIATVAYKVPLKKGRSLDFHLRVQNVLNDTRIIYQSGQTRMLPRDGDYMSPARVRTPALPVYREPINFQFTTTFVF